MGLLLPVIFYAALVVEIEKSAHCDSIIINSVKGWFIRGNLNQAISAQLKTAPSYPADMTMNPGSAEGSPSARRHSRAQTSRCLLMISSAKISLSAVYVVDAVDEVVDVNVVVVIVCCYLARPLPSDCLAPTEDDVSRLICRPAGGRGERDVRVRLCLPPSLPRRRSARRAAVRTLVGSGRCGVDGERERGGGENFHTNYKVHHCHWYLSSFCFCSTVQVVDGFSGNHL